MSATAVEAALPPHSVDGFLGGMVTLIQPRTGHRAGLDAALLQAVISTDAAGQAIELGAGSGAASFGLAARTSGLSVLSVEREPTLVACAAAALAMAENSAFARRVQVIEADVTAPRPIREAAGLIDGSADWVLMNPPFDVAGRVRASPDPERREAHVGGAETLAAWVRTAGALLKAGGRLALIHRASALHLVLDTLSGRFGDIAILPVHPGEGAPASRIVLRGRRGSRAGLTLLPGLVLHQTHGGWTPAADDLLRGRAALPFGQAGLA